MSRIVAEVLDPGSCKTWADQELCLPRGGTETDALSE